MIGDDRRAPSVLLRHVGPCELSSARFDPGARATPARPLSASGRGSSSGSRVGSTSSYRARRCGSGSRSSMQAEDRHMRSRRRRRSKAVSKDSSPRRVSVSRLVPGRTGHGGALRGTGTFLGGRRRSPEWMQGMRIPSAGSLRARPLERRSRSAPIRRHPAPLPRPTDLRAHPAAKRTASTRVHPSPPRARVNCS